MTMPEVLLREIIDQIDAIADWSNPQRIDDFIVSHEDCSETARVARDGDGDWRVEEL